MLVLEVLFLLIIIFFFFFFFLLLLSLNTPVLRAQVCFRLTLNPRLFLLYLNVPALGAGYGAGSDHLRRVLG